MRKGILVVLAVFYFLCIFISYIAAQEKDDLEIAVYLKSGEIIKGKLVEKTPEMVTIDKFGNKLSFKFAEILKMEEAESGKGLSTKYSLPFSTAIITYDLKGYLKGKEVIYIDATNNKVAIETSAVSEYAGFSNKDNSLQIYDEKAIYNVNLGERSCISIEREGVAVRDIFGEPFYFGRPVEQESFLGKDCNVYKLPEGKVYFWNGILLKDERKDSSDFNFYKEATEIKLDVELPAEKFKVPEGIEIKSMEKFTEDLQQEQKKYQQQMSDDIKKQLEKGAETDPQTKKVLAEITKQDGTLDLEKYYQLIQQDSEKILLEQVKMMEGGEKIIQEATSQDGKLDMVKLSSLYYTKQNEKYEAEAFEYQKKELLRRAEMDPEYKKILEECTGKDGVLDIKKAQGLMQEQEKKELLNKVKKLKDGDELIQKATTSLGEIDQFRLQSLFYEKQRQLEEKTMAIIEAARVYEGEKKYAQALQKYTEAIELNPLNSFNYLERSRIYELMGEDQKAIADLNSLMQDQSDMNAYNFTQRADIYMRLGKYQEAIADYTKALGIENLNALEEAKARKEILQKADGSVEEGVTQKLPLQSIYTLEKRAKAYCKTGENQKAIVDLTKIIEESPQGSSLGDAYFLRGLIYRQLNEIEKMKQDWQKAESLGDKLVEGEYVQGRKQGPFIWYYADGPVLSRATYVDDKKEGEFIRFHRNGQISDKGFYKQDKFEGPYTWFVPSGKKSKEGTFKNDKQEGIFTTYDPPTGNIIKKMSFANGELNGECVVVYWDDGQPQDKGTFKNGLRHGMSYRYYQNGQVEQEVPYENGLENGTATLYNLNGSFKKKVFFKAGQRTGESYTP